MESNQAENNHQSKQLDTQVTERAVFPILKLSING